MVYLRKFLPSGFRVNYPVKLVNDSFVFLVVIYVCLNVKSLKYYVFFVLKYVTQLRITSTMEKVLASGG